MHARPRALPENQRYPKRLGPVFNPISQVPATTDHRSPITKKTFGSVKSMAAAEAWGAALPMAPTWVLVSVAAWQSAMPMPLQWGWPLASRSLSE